MSRISNDDLFTALGSLIVMVAEMRAAQRLYYKTRSAEDLAEAKRLEREMDARLEAVREHTPDHPILPNLSHP